VRRKDCYDEDAHRLLMQCFVRLGHWTRTLRQYRLCEGALRQEYDTTPFSETQALYARILSVSS
jgi:DNA-binding SARP family transcriptional activator